MKDGLRSEQMRSIDLLASGSLTADLISGAGLQVGAGEVGTAEIADAGVTAVKQSFAGTGSPPTGGHMLQAGESILAGGSAWVVYPKAFTAAPVIVAQEINQAVNYDVNVHVAAGSVDTGSFIATGSDAATPFNWMALGSGTF